MSRERLTVGGLFARLKADDRPVINAARAADIILRPFEQLAGGFHLGAGDGHSSASTLPAGSIVREHRRDIIAGRLETCVGHPV
jgi:hypothetical protein